MDYLRSFSYRDSVYGLIGGILLPAAAIIVSWSSNRGFEQLFNTNVIPVFVIGFVLAGMSANAWKNNIRLVLPAAVIPVSAAFLFRYCIGSCLLNYQIFYWASLAAAFTVYFFVILYRSRKVLIEFLRGGEEKIHRDIGLALGIGIIYYSVFLLANMAVRWTIISRSLFYRSRTLLFSLGLILAATVTVWLYVRRNLKLPILVHFLWVVIWSVSLKDSIAYMPLGYFYSHSYVLPATDYILTWPSLLALVTLSALIEIGIKKASWTDRFF